MAGSLLQLLEKAGFKGDALRTAWAIAMRESGGNAQAFNGNAATGDKSYGLFQINMLGGLGPARLKQYGLASDQALFDPTTNARVAYLMSHGGTDFGAWGLGPNAYAGAPAAARASFERYYGEYPGASGGTPLRAGAPSAAPSAPAGSDPGPYQGPAQGAPGLIAYLAKLAQQANAVVPVVAPQPVSVPTLAPITPLGITLAPQAPLAIASGGPLG